MPKKKKSLRVPQTPLVDVADALHSIGAATHVAIAALANQSNEVVSVRAGTVLAEHVLIPLAEQEAIISGHARKEHLVSPRRRKKHAPNGSRKGKKRQRNRWKDRQKAKKPWDL